MILLLAIVLMNLSFAQNEINPGFLIPMEETSKCNVLELSGDNFNTGVKGKRQVKIENFYKPISQKPPIKRHTESTFLIDSNEAILQVLHEEANRDVGLKIGRAEEYVNAYIKDKRNNNVLPASEVAQKKMGNSLNHTILQAALFRISRKPSRIIYGVIVLKESASFKAYRHFWNEIYEDKKWLKADAFLLGEKDKVMYIPFIEFEDESAGYNHYAMSMPVITKANCR